MPDIDFVVVGDINIDVVPEPIPTETEIKKDGQVFLDDLEYRRGGQGANFAVKLSELGSQTIFQGKIGDDRHGKFLKEHLREKEVKPVLEESPEVKTGTTMAVTWENGERHYLSFTQNNSELQIEDIDFEILPESGHLARRGVWFSEPMLEGGNKELLRRAKDKGLETSIDLHWDPQWDRENSNSRKRRKLFLETLEHADFLFGNEEELKELTQKENLFDAVQEIRNHGEPRIIVHQGADGSKIFDGEEIEIPAPEVENPVNPTGTGDVYDAAFINAWRNGESLKVCGEAATEEAVKHLKGL